jgi:hypothetical protein
MLPRMRISRISLPQPKYLARRIAAENKRRLMLPWTRHESFEGTAPVNLSRFDDTKRRRRTPESEDLIRTAETAMGCWIEQLLPM